MLRFECGMFSANSYIVMLFMRQNPKQVDSVYRKQVVCGHKPYRHAPIPTQEFSTFWLVPSHKQLIQSQQT